MRLYDHWVWDGPWGGIVVRISSKGYETEDSMIEQLLHMYENSHNDWCEIVQGGVKVSPDLWKTMRARGYLSVRMLGPG
jgi:hypothetical protein